eukprot:gene46676-16284_t
MGDDPARQRVAHAAQQPQREPPLVIARVSRASSDAGGDGGGEDGVPLSPADFAKAQQQRQHAGGAAVAVPGGALVCAGARAPRCTQQSDPGGGEYGAAAAMPERTVPRAAAAAAAAEHRRAAFGELVYAQLLQAKRDVVRLRREREVAETARRRIRRDTRHALRPRSMNAKPAPPGSPRAGKAPKAAEEEAKGKRPRSRRRGSAITAGCGAVRLSDAARADTQRKQLARLMRELRTAATEIDRLRAHPRQQHAARLEAAAAELEERCDALRDQTSAEARREGHRLTRARLREVEEGVRDRGEQHDEEDSVRRLRAEVARLRQRVEQENEAAARVELREDQLARKLDQVEQLIRRAEDELDRLKQEEHEAAAAAMQRRADERRDELLQKIRDAEERAAEHRQLVAQLRERHEGDLLLERDAADTRQETFLAQLRQHQRPEQAAQAGHEAQLARDLAKEKQRNDASSAEDGHLQCRCPELRYPAVAALREEMAALRRHLEEQRQTEVDTRRQLQQQLEKSEQQRRGAPAARRRETSRREKGRVAAARRA